jgi:hypothetical protein
MQQLFLVISSILVAVSYLVYINAIIKGQAKPHRTTRLVILIISTIAALSLFAQGSQAAFWLLGISAIFCLVIFLLSLKYGMGGWSKLDIVCLLIGLSGIVLWQISNDPVLALYSSITADFIGVVPTLVKTYKLPKSESWSFFLIGVFSSGFNLLAAREWSLQEISYPIYLVFINGALVFLIFRKSFLKLS